MSNSTGEDERAPEDDLKKSSTKIWRELRSLLLLQNPLVTNIHPYNFSLMGRSMRFWINVSNTLMSDSMGPSPSVKFDTVMAQFLVASSGYWTPSMQFRFRISWSWDFSKSMTYSEPQLWICALGLVHLFWRQGRNFRTILQRGRAVVLSPYHYLKFVKFWNAI